MLIKGVNKQNKRVKYLYLQIIDKIIMKILNQNIISILVITTCIFGFKSKAQQFKPNTEIGILLGASYYLGDLNTNHFYQSLPAAGLTVRQNINKRIAYKAQAMFINLRSDERDSEDLKAKERGLHFRSQIYELSGQIEFNFLPYQPGNPLYTWTPFVYTGISLFNFNPQAENKDGEWVDLQELGTEGQGTPNYPDREKYALTQVSIPIGGGIKIAVNESFNIIFEYSARKTFTDYIDDVSTSYPLSGITGISEETYEMSDPNAPFNADEDRGNPGKKDWYSFAGITLSFKLNNKTKGCDYY